MLKFNKELASTCSYLTRNGTRKDTEFLSRYPLRAISKAKEGCMMLKKIDQMLTGKKMKRIVAYQELDKLKMLRFRVLVNQLELQRIMGET
jgi:hypothetical protein